MTGDQGVPTPAVGGVEILRALGRGSEAVVWLGRQTALDRLCAVKQVPLAAGADPRPLLREARLLAALAHPHIVAVYDAVATPTDVVIVMEYLPAGTLADWMRNGGPSWKETLRITDEVASAIAAAAGTGAVHRDVKPANILIDDRGRCRVADFGIATLQPRRSTPGVGPIVGTPAYMPPEQARGLGEEAASDVYSLGVVAYQLLTGRLPFVNQDAAAAMHDHAFTPPPRPRAWCADLPAAAERELLRCLDKRPARRRSAPEFARHLRSAMERGVPNAQLLSRPSGSSPAPQGCAFPDRVDSGDLTTVAVSTTSASTVEQSLEPAVTARGGMDPTVTAAPAVDGGWTNPAAAGRAGRGREPTRPSGRPSHHLRRVIVPSAAAIMVGVIAARILHGGGDQRPVQVTEVRLSAVSTVAHCPEGDLTVVADVAVNGGQGIVAYRWDRPDGAASSGTATVPSGTSDVTLDLHLHFSGEQAAAGSVALEVLSPSVVRSRPLSIEYRCP